MRSSRGLRLGIFALDIAPPSALVLGSGIREYFD